MIVRRYRALLFALVVVGCGGPDPNPAAMRAAAITGGTLHSGHSWVQRLRFSLTGGTKLDGACTAMLVGKKTVLTAAHCAGYGNTGLFVGTLGYRAAKTIRHPQWKSSRAWEYDIGLVLLNLEPKGLTPAKLALTAPAVGAAVTMVGFGETSRGKRDDGVKRIAKNKIASVAPLYLNISGSGNACSGDSGGPAIVDVAGDEGIAGILSWVTGACGRSTTRATRVDKYISWVVKESGGDVLLLDKIAPRVAITAPTSGATTGLTIDVTATVTDNVAVTSVELLVDGAAALAPLTKPPYAFKTTLKPGSRVLTVAAKDAAGNRGTASVTVTAAAPGQDAGAVDATAAAPDSGIEAGVIRPDAGTVGGDSAAPSDGGCAVAAESTPRAGVVVALLLLFARRRCASLPRRGR